MFAKISALELRPLPKQPQQSSASAAHSPGPAWEFVLQAYGETALNWITNLIADIFIHFTLLFFGFIFRLFYSQLWQQLRDRHKFSEQQANISKPQDHNLCIAALHQ